LHPSGIATIVPYNRDQTLLLPPDDLAHVVVAAVELLPLTSFPVNPQAGGKPQYHPRRIEQATLRDIGRRFVAAKLHLDHDTIAVFRRANKVAFDAKKGRPGRPPKPPDAASPPERQSNLTETDSALMRHSDAHDHRQAYNAQAVVCADDSQLILAAKLETDHTKTRYDTREQAIEWVFGIVKSVMGFRRFHLRGRRNIGSECLLISLAYNCRRLHRLQAA